MSEQLPFDNFECDHCGACCQSLIVEAHDYDVRREPRLYQIFKGDRQKLRDGEHCIMLYDSETKACPFLVPDGSKRVCSIYATRPVACVMVEPGDAKCQQARRINDLPLLRDRDGNEPAREMLEASCEDYDLDIDEVLQ
jgi:Fe-S-cluster containining protein